MDSVEPKGQYAIIWSGNTDRNRIYVSYTSDFVNVTSPQVFFDPGFSVIDGHMEVGVNGYNYLYYKNEKDFKLYGTKSATLSPGSFNSNTYTTGYGAPFTGSHTEAAIVIKSITSNTWWLWGDSYNPVNAVFYAWQSNDITTNSWKALDKKLYNAPLNAKHATIVPITGTEYNSLISKCGAPAWNRLKAYNLPEKYVRHSNSDCLIASAPFDPTADMQWKIVQGLADPNGVSFESVNSPGSYLRHSNYILYLQKDDGSTSFDQDATFYKKTGFSDSTWTSFSSYNFPDRYIRSINSKLQIDPITSSSTDIDKQSATFLICY
ncbi:MAG: AbfB domain-containing protein [Bacillota bacterium]|nr:AbfB domain-containing protein [Bacillota bacterium]